MLGLLLLAGIIGVLALFDPRALPFAPRCMWLSLTGLRCVGCGLTRGLHALLRGDLVEAVLLNPLILLVPFLLGGLAWCAVRTLARGTPPALPEVPALVSRGLLVLLSGFWLYRTVADLLARLG